MPLRLPEQQYIGVQSLGRRDPYGPMRGAGQTAMAIQKGFKNVEAWARAEQEQQLATGVAAYKQHTNDLQRRLTSQDTVDVKDGRWKGFEFTEDDRKHFETVKDPETGQQRTVIAGWRVADRLYDYGEAKIRKKLTGEMTGAQNQAFNRQVAGYQIQVTNKVVAHHYDGRHAHLSTRFTEAYEAAIANGDEQGARMAARQAFTTGAWTIDEYEGEMKKVGGRVDGLFYNARFVQASKDGDVEALEELAHEMWTDGTNRMSGEARVRMQSQIYDEQIRIKGRAEAAADKARKRASSKATTAIVADIQDKGYQDWQSLRDKLIQLEPDDARTVMALNANATYGPQRSDDATVRHIEFMIRDLRGPAEGLSYDERVAAIKQRIREATGMSVDGRIEGPSDLNNDDATRLLDDLNKTVAAPFRDPRIGRVEDRIYRAITRAGKSQFGMGTDQAAVTQLNEVIKKFDAAIDQQGDQFDPEAWYDENIDMIENATYRGNLTDVTIEKMGAYVVRNTKDRSIDVEATTQRVLDARAAGDITDEEARDYIDAIQPPTG